MKNKTLYILIIVVLVIAGIYVAKQITEEKEVTQTGTNVFNNTTEENNNEKNEIEENNIIKSEVNEIGNNVVEDETTNTLDPKEEAKQIVKDNWGEDDSVYFSYDGIENGKHVVCVRERSTTKELYRYYVNLETGTFEIE